jgi:hypothetical protein
MPFHHPDDAEKWCEIHRTSGHDLKQCKTFLDRKKMPRTTAHVTQEPQWGKHGRANPPDDDEQIGEINIIPGQSFTPIGCINLEVSCGTRDNKRKEMLMFEVASFDIRYNYILRTFLLKFVVVIHTAYATLKMLAPKCVITIKAD